MPSEAVMFAARQAAFHVCHQYFDTTRWNGCLEIWIISVDCSSVREQCWLFEFASLGLAASSHGLISRNWSRRCRSPVVSFLSRGRIKSF